MERRARLRSTVLVVLVFTVMALYCLRLFKVQSAPEESGARKQDSYTYYTYVDSSRGPILDRNGTVLVTNRASYNLVIINYPLFNSDSPNGNLMTLLQQCRKLGLDVTHHFPVGPQRPYEYHWDNIDSAWQTYYDRFLTSRGWDSDITARTLMDNLRKDYNIPEDMDPRDAYDLICVRYELELRGIKGMPLEYYTLARDVSAVDLAAIMELGIPGVIVETTTVREYKTPYAAHLLGHTGLMEWEEYDSVYREQDYAMDSVVGKDGVELAFEQYLHGSDGYKKTTVSAEGEVLEESYISAPKPGSAVEITLDINLQAVAERALENKILDLRENGVGRNQEGRDVEGGAVVVVEVDSGEVLVSASYPTFDLANFNRDFNKLLEAEFNPIYNRALLAGYPPGSIYKMVTAITAMDHANVGPHMEIEDKGKYEKFAEEKYTPACYIYTSSGVTHGFVNIMEAISVSCNYFFYDVGLMISTEDLDATAKALGLGEPTGIELPENTGSRSNAETKARVYEGTTDAYWVEGDKLQGAIGQGLNHFTPLQMACYTAALANNGTRYDATLLRRVVSWDYRQLLEENSPSIASSLTISPVAQQAVKEGMILAAEEGTAATFLAGYPIPVAAKTGTAQHGSGGSDHCSFVCYAPADDPQIAIAIYLEKGAQGGNLGDIAAQIMDAYFAQSSKYETVLNENTVS